MGTRILAALLLAFVLTALAVGAVMLLAPLFEGASVTLFGLTLEPVSVVAVPSVLAVLGIVIAVLVAYLAFVLRLGDERARWIAERQTREHIITTAHLRQLYDQSPVPYLTLMPDGTVHNPNVAAMRLYGMTVEELQGRTLFEMHPEEDLERARSLFARFRSNVPFEREEIRVVRKDGAIRWVMLSVFVFRTLGERGRRGLVTLADITDQKNLDRAKTEFVSLASHQLRTPLSTVKWHTDLLLSDKYGPLNGKQREHMEQVHRGNQAMVDLVDLLLNVSRIEMGTLPTDIRDTDAIALVDDVLEELSPQITQKRTDVSKHYGDGFAALRSDPKLLRIVIQNLLSNAVKYTRESGEVDVTLARESGKHAIIVRDNGYGIPPEQQAMIFTKLFRADNVRKESVDGNGLGLYLTKSIVEMLGGSISFVSELDRGTTFTVLLP